MDAYQNLDILPAMVGNFQKSVFIYFIQFKFHYVLCLKILRSYIEPQKNNFHIGIIIGISLLAVNNIC